MSLRELKDEIFLVLQIKEGHGFGFALNPLVITANLVGNIHESFITEPSSQPKFEHEFVWVLEKTKMKGIWADKAPIRVECFTVCNSRRSKIGYVILNVKDAQIVQDESKITDKQIRLLGLSKEASLFKPELILSFYITDVPIKSPQLTPQYSPRLESNTIQMIDGPPKVMIGSGHERFTISIQVDTTSNLKELLPSGSELDPSQLTYSYYLLGMEIVSGSPSKHSVQLIVLSSLASLKTYFLREPVVPIKVFIDTLLIGEASINMKNLILSEEFHSKKSKHHSRAFSCHCEITPTHKVTENPSTPKTFIDCIVTFNSEEPVIKKKSESSTLLPQIGAGGDADRQVVVPLQRPVTAPLTPRPSGSETYRTQPTFAKHMLCISITRLDLDQQLPAQTWLRISHPYASASPQNCPVPKKWVPQQWKLPLTRQTLEPCELFLMSEKQEVAKATLIPPSYLFDTPTANLSEHIAVLERMGERVGEVAVTWESLSTTTTTLCAPTQTVSTLTDSSLTPPTQSRQNGLTCTQDVDVLSPRARELKILSFVEELEDWAEKQRILVMEGLKEEEAAWWSQWEAEVGGQVTEGRQLVKALHAMKDQLRRQEISMQDGQQKLKVYKEELERIYRSKLQEFKDLSRRMQDEFNHKLSLIASDKAALEIELEKLRDDNNDMKQRLKEAEARADKDKRLADNLSHDVKMLSEKLSMEQESKQFFKDHCRKAEQEIHRLNCLRQQELESRLFNDKKTLEQLAFQHIIVEKNDLKQDQKVLDEIRYQLLHGPSTADTISNSNGESFLDKQQFADERHIRRPT